MPPVDRTSSCPFLVRCFVAQGAHFDAHEYSPASLPASQVQLYLWKDATFQDVLRQLAAARGLPQQHAKISIRHLFPDADQRAYQSKDLGIVFLRELSRDDIKGPGVRTLADVKFLPGDLLEFAFVSNERPFERERADGPASGGAGRGRPRPNEAQRASRLSGGAFQSRAPIGMWSRGGGQAGASGGRGRGDRTPPLKRDEDTEMQ